MILQSLERLARREGLVENPHFEVKEVHWQIRLKPNGRFIELLSLMTPQAGRGRARPRDRGPSIPVPRPFPGASRTGTAPDAGFLVENSAFLLGLDLTKEQRVARRPGEAARRTEAFRTLVDQGAQATGDAGLAAVAAFLHSSADTEAARREVMNRATENELAANHLVTFVVEGQDELVHLRPKVMDHWSKVREALEVDGKQQQCLITGATAPAIDKHPPIKKVPGATGSGVAIVSFNKSAFESYGFERNDNAPVSCAAAEAYTQALNRLLDPSYPDPRDPNVRMPEQRVLLSDDTVAVFWTDEESAVPAAIVPAVGGGDPEAMATLAIAPDVLSAWKEAIARSEPGSSSAEPLRAAHQAPWTGIRPGQLRDARPFRLLILSGGQGRATVRAFHTSRIAETVEAVRQWFADLSLSSFRGRPALYRLLSALAVRGERKNLARNLASEVFVAVLTAAPLPAFVLEAAVRRCRSEADTKVTQERAALIKAWLNRARRDPALRSRLNHEGVAYEEVKPTMNDEERNKGYLLGRMFACVERMQALALGDVGASVTDRYFSSACATPQVVFPRLLKTEVHHFRKAREGKFGSTARWLHGQIDRLATWLVGEANGMNEGESVETFLRRTAGHTLIGFPAFLPLAEQGLFTLGYHQQRAEFFKKRVAADEGVIEDEASLSDEDAGALGGGR